MFFVVHSKKSLLCTKLTLGKEFLEEIKNPNHTFRNRRCHHRLPPPPRLQPCRHLHPCPASFPAHHHSSPHRPSCFAPSPNVRGTLPHATPRPRRSSCCTGFAAVPYASHFLQADMPPHPSPLHTFAKPPRSNAARAHAVVPKFVIAWSIETVIHRLEVAKPPP